MQDVVFFINKNLILCLAWATVLLLLIAVEIKERLTGPKSLDVSELTKLLNSGEAVLVDLRADSEFNAGHISQAENIALSAVNDHNVIYRKIEKDKDKFILLVCKDGIQSKQQGFKLKSKGLEKVGYLNGGMVTWKNEGLPTITS